jgi:hypothetical protein
MMHRLDLRFYPALADESELVRHISALGSGGGCNSSRF